jgi:hypothetical protein
MKFSNVIKSAAVAALAAGFAAHAFAGEKETKITMDKVPAAVQEAVKKYAPGAEIKGIEEGKSDGTKVIEFDVVKDGKASEVAFRLDGRLFKTEEKVALTDCPAPVQKTIAKLSEKATAGQPEKIVQEGKTSYEIVIEKKGKKIEYTLSPEGKVTEKEKAGED